MNLSLEALRFLRERGLEPTKMDDGVLRGRRERTDEVRVRDEFIARFGFAILTPDVLEVVRSCAPLLEVGAGSGYWAYEMQRAGIEIVPTDPGTGKYAFGYWSQLWTDVKRLDAVTAVRAYPAHTLLTVWPDYDQPWATDALRAYRGERILYVGEWDGATADDEFQEVLEKDFDQERVISLPVFRGLPTRLMIWVRRAKDGRQP